MTSEDKLSNLLKAADGVIADISTHRRGYYDYILTHRSAFDDLVNACGEAHGYDQDEVDPEAALCEARRAWAQAAMARDRAYKRYKSIQRILRK